MPQNDRTPHNGVAKPRAKKQENPIHDDTKNVHPGAFARALTRAVFGRNYWDDRLERERVADGQKKKKVKPPTKS